MLGHAIILNISDHFFWYLRHKRFWKIITLIKCNINMRFFLNFTQTNISTCTRPGVKILCIYKFVQVWKVYILLYFFDVFATLFSGIVSNFVFALCNKYYNQWQFCFENFQFPFIWWRIFKIRPGWSYYFLTCLYLSFYICIYIYVSLSLIHSEGLLFLLKTFNGLSSYRKPFFECYFYLSALWKIFHSKTLRPPKYWLLEGFQILIHYFP